MRQFLIKRIVVIALMLSILIRIPVWANNDNNILHAPERYRNYVSNGYTHEWTPSYIWLPHVYDGIIYDTVLFGNYDQWRSDSGTTSVNPIGLNIGDIYKENQPIKWRVLSVDDDSILLLSDSILAYRRFYESTIVEGTLSQNKLIDWLNNDFYNRAFNEDEQELLLPIGEQQEKVFLLSSDDIKNQAYGFLQITNNKWAMCDNEYYGGTKITEYNRLDMDTFRLPGGIWAIKPDDDIYSANPELKYNNYIFYWDTTKYVGEGEKYVKIGEVSMLFSPYWWLCDNQYVDGRCQIVHAPYSDIAGVRPLIRIKKDSNSYSFAGSILLDIYKERDRFGVPYDREIYTESEKQSETELDTRIVSANIVVKQKIDLKEFTDQRFDKYNVTPKFAKVSKKKQLLTAKKKGTVTITGYNKRKNGSIVETEITKIADVEIEQPVLAKSIVVPLSAGTVSGNDYIKSCSVVPSLWTSSKLSVASVDPVSGLITLNGIGKTKIVVYYGEGKNAARYSFKLKVSE